MAWVSRAQVLLLLVLPSCSTRELPLPPILDTWETWETWETWAPVHGHRRLAWGAGALSELWGLDQDLETLQLWLQVAQVWMLKLALSALLSLGQLWLPVAPAQVQVQPLCE